MTVNLKSLIWNQLLNQNWLSNRNLIFRVILVPEPIILEPKSITSSSHILLLDQGVDYHDSEMIFQIWSYNRDDFPEQTNDQSLEIIIQEPLIDQSFENFFEDKIICLDDSIRNALVSYTPPKAVSDLSFEMMFEDELKFIGIHIVYAPIEMCNDDQVEMSISGKKSRRGWGNWKINWRGWNKR